MRGLFAFGLIISLVKITFTTKAQSHKVFIQCLCDFVVNFLMILNLFHHAQHVSTEDLIDVTFGVTTP